MKKRQYLSPQESFSCTITDILQIDYSISECNKHAEYTADTLYCEHDDVIYQDCCMFVTCGLAPFPR